jgi:uncharacterized protein (TIGR03086 family)
MLNLDISCALAYHKQMTTIPDTRPLHRTAVQASVHLVSAVTPDDLGRPTPCSGWNLGDLLAHMTVQHRGFAAAARGHGDDLALWDPTSVTDALSRDPAGTYFAAATDVLQAFAVDDSLTAHFALPEFGPGATFPGDMAIGFHFIDYVVHSWDVARSIGASLDLPDDVITAALPLALAVPDGDFRTAAQAPFQRAIDADASAGSMERILLHLGRFPAWQPTRA